MYKEKKITIKPDRDYMFDLFNDHYKENSDHITVTAKEDKDYFQIALWGTMTLADETGITFNDVRNLLHQFQELDARLSKIIGLAELARYATGFEIPEDKTFYGISIDELAKKDEE